LQPAAPTDLDFVIRIRLAKDPDERWQNHADIGRQLRRLSESPSRATTTPPPRRATWIVTAAIVAAIASLAAIAGAFWWNSSGRAGSSPVQFQVVAPDKAVFNFRGLSGPPAPSPDGTHIVFVAYAQGQQNTRSLWLRALSSSEVHMIAGTEGGTYPFWSPDS